MNLAGLGIAIKTRLNVDTASGGLGEGASNRIITGFFNTRPTPEFNFPFIVYDAYAVQQDDMFSKDGQRIRVRFHVFHNESAAGIDTLTICSTIIGRIYGDTSGGSAPTYGFHRWQVGSIQGSWTGTHMQRIGGNEDHEEGILHFVEEYQLYASK